MGAATVRRLQQRVERILRLLQTSAGIEPVQGQQHEQDVDGVPAFGFSNGRSRSSTPSFSMWSAPAPLQHLSSPPSSRSAGGTESEGSTWTTEVKGAAALTLALPPLPSPSLVAAAASMASATGPHGSPRSGHLPLWMRGSKGASVMLTECDTDAAIAAVPAEHQEQFLQRVQEQRQQLRACLAQQQDSYYQHSTSDTAQHAASKGAARPLPLPLLEGEDEAGVEEVEVGEMPLFPTQAHDLATGEPLANIIPVRSRPAPSRADWLSSAGHEVELARTRHEQLYDVLAPLYRRLGRQLGPVRSSSGFVARRRAAGRLWRGPPWLRALAAVLLHLPLVS